MKKKQTAVENIHAGHRMRLKQRFLQQNIDGFDPISALEMLLFFSVPRRDTNELAHRLLERFHTLDGVFDAPIEELRKVDGIGEQSAFLIKMIPAYARLYAKAKHSTTRTITTVEQAGYFLMPMFLGVTVEHAYLMCLNSKGKVLDVILVGEGTECTASISIRKVVAESLRLGATQVVLAHNHPGGLALPSESDMAVTRNVEAALRLVDIQLADHIIVADNDFVSMRASRYIASESLGIET